MNRYLSPLGSQKGLTLIELVISAGISAMAVLATLSVTTAALSTIQTTMNRGELASDANLYSQYFAQEIKNAGGLDLPPQSAYYVENACAAVNGNSGQGQGNSLFPACDSSDRLTLAFSSEAHKCTITAYNTATRLAALNWASPGVCCFADPAELEHKHVIVTNMNYFVQRWVQNADAVNCRLRLEDGPMAGNDYERGAPPNWIAGGSYVVPVNLESFYLDRGTNQLFRYTFYPSSLFPAESSNDPYSGLAQAVGDQIYDLQFAIGFDFSPADGLITDTPTVTGTNEWLFNGAGQSRWDNHFSLAPPSSLRMVEVAWILGAKDAPKANSVKVLNGPLRAATSYYLEQEVLKIGITSNHVFN